MYNTKQRIRILDFLKDNKDKHLSANDIQYGLKSIGLNISIVTIYRFLDILTRDNIIRKWIISNSDSACYQFIDNDCKTHYHLKCDNCGGIIHLDCDYIQNISEHIKTTHNFYINDTKTIFHGICEKCNNGDSIHV